MRSFWFRCLGCIGALTLSLAMLAVNYAFEAAGSIPDFEACGFLAGSSFGLMIVYPLTAAVLSHWLTAVLLRAFPERRSSLPRLGRDAAFAGSTFYLALGMAVSVGRHGILSIPLQVFALSALYVMLAGMAGWLGALRTLSTKPEPILQPENG